MPLEQFLCSLSEEIEDADEETFLLYSNPIPSQNLGFIDPKASTLELTLANRDVTIHQSPSLLSSTRAGGTTGAVLWKVTPMFAEWLSSPKNVLFQTGTLSATSSILELGCGISPMNALALAPRVANYVLSDQTYVQKLVTQNLADNPLPTGRKGHKGRGNNVSMSTSTGTIQFKVLDWETDEVTPVLASPSDSFDAVLACDCVFNYALIEPFVQACADACKLRSGRYSSISNGQHEDESRQGEGTGKGADTPCLCIVAQQLRNDDVFRSWLTAFQEVFTVWRVDADMLPEGLRPSEGFVVHVGVLKG